MTSSPHDVPWPVVSYRTFLKRVDMRQRIEPRLGIRPHTPEDNSLVERAHRTLGEAFDEFEVETYWEARDRIAEIVEWYNHRRLYSGINFLRPIDYYRGDPERLLRIRQRKIEQARHH